MRSGTVLLAQVSKAGEADVSLSELGCKFVVTVKRYPSAQCLLIISCITIFCLASFFHRLHESGDNRVPKGTHCWASLNVGREGYIEDGPSFRSTDTEWFKSVSAMSCTDLMWLVLFLTKSSLMNGFNRTVDYLKCQENFLSWIFVYFVIRSHQKSKYCFH